MIKIFEFFGVLPAIFLLGFIYSCEDQAAEEVSTNKLEDEVLNTSGAELNRKMEEQTLKWCVFGNYCDATGRHYPAKFQVSIWNYRDGEKQEQLYSDLINEVELNEDGDYAGSTVCLELANAPGIDEYYVEIMILNSEAYREISERIIREGVIDENDIKSLYTGKAKVDYFHFREGCDSSDNPELFQM